MFLFFGISLIVISHYKIVANVHALSMLKWNSFSQNTIELLWNKTWFVTQYRSIHFFVIGYCKT